MVESLRDEIASLRAFAPKLNASVESAAATIRDVDAFLEEIGAGTPAFRMYHSQVAPSDLAEDGVAEARRYLAYDRFAGKFQIHIQEEHLVKDGNGQFNDVAAVYSRSWTNAPRAEKLQSYKELPQLLARIAGDIRSLSETADETTALVREQCEGLIPTRADEDQAATKPAKIKPFCPTWFAALCRDAKAGKLPGGFATVGNKFARAVANTCPDAYEEAEWDERLEVLAACLNAGDLPRAEAWIRDELPGFIKAVGSDRRHGETFLDGILHAAQEEEVDVTER